MIAARNPEKDQAAVARIQAAHPRASVLFEALDLASLISVASFAARMADQRQRIDLLVNNAGVAAPTRRKETADGFELQFGTNHLGHFALAARLLPLLRRGTDARVVTVSSVMHKTGRIDFDDLQCERRRYSPTRTYSQSKLANLLFAREPQRRSDGGGWGLLSDAAHPGMTRTELVANGLERDHPRLITL
jgi:NAD(P)-dependent dehydrogenase (short-subunit alcohol dehydrogenase family)